MTTAARSVLFVDLDGTLVLDNSFHRFLLAMWRHGGIGSRVRLLGAAGERVLRRRVDPRVQMKRRALTAFSRTSQRRRAAIVGDVVDELCATVSAPVAAEVDRWRRRDAMVVLATAAPDCYAEPFAERLGLDGVIATPTVVDADWSEALGAIKRDRCLAWLQARGAVGAEIGVITDHVDDAALLGLADRAWVQGAGREFDAIHRVVNHDAAVAFIDVESAQAGGGVWLWFDDRPSGPHDVWEVRTILSKHRYALLYVGDGVWRRVQPGDGLQDAVLRSDCPRPPSTRERLAVAVRRRAVRDRLGVFH